MGEYRTHVWGEWDPPLEIETNDVVIDTPTEINCMFCGEFFKEGDQGLYGTDGNDVFTPRHRECGFRSAIGGIGHCVNHQYYCSPDVDDPDAGFSYRESALFVWAKHIKNRNITQEFLEKLMSRRNAENLVGRKEGTKAKQKNC